MRRSNIHLIRSPKGKKKKKEQSAFEEVTAENSPALMKDKILILKARQILIQEGRKGGS